MLRKRLRGHSDLQKLKNASLTSADLFEKPLYYTEKNAKKNGVENIKIVKTNVFEKPKITEKFDLIVSNPPYIKSGVIPTLSREVAREPRQALDGGADGLDFYRAICENYVSLLGSGGMLAVEIGFDQKEEVTEIFGRYFKNVIVRPTLRETTGRSQEQINKKRGKKQWQKKA